jgi:hypothetical protein
VNCWICGALADTREHKFKRTDLVRSSETWTAGDLPYYFSGSGTRRLQSPHSELATFGKVLCNDCNSSKTQPFDEAYETFSDWVNQQGEAVLAMSELDFTLIYGDMFQSSVLDLTKYFVKYLGCRLASEGCEIPAGLSASLGSTDLRPFEVSLARNRLLGDAPVRGRGVLGNFPTFGTYSISTQTSKGPYLAGLVVGHLDVIIRHGFPDRYPWEGDPIDHCASGVRLGIYEGKVSGGHPVDGDLPFPNSSRTFRVAGQELQIPILSPEHIQAVLSLPRAEPGVSLNENLDRKLKIAHAILSPHFPAMTMPFLEENLSPGDIDALWRLVFHPGAPANSQPS